MLRALYENSLLLVGTAGVVLSLAGQAYTGFCVHADDRAELGQGALSFGEYLRSAHFLEATFENWESEFLQMGLYVLLTVWFRQRGSAESKPLYGDAEVDRDPDPNREGAPWAVRRGGLVARLYRNSLGLAFGALFVASVVLHAVGGAGVESGERASRGEPAISWSAYLWTTRFWFESLQNWQSEFVSIVAVVGLSIVFRQQGSPESKPVDAPHAATEE